MLKHGLLPNNQISTSMATTNNGKLHIAMFPWLAFGHIIPFLELAKLLAQKGHRVSFISTPRNIDRLPRFPPYTASKIELVELSWPHQDNLPQNAEATIDVPYHKVPFLKKAHDGLEGLLARFLETSTPDWIIHDFAPHWLPPITARLGVSRACFSIVTAWTLCFFGPSSTAMINGDDPRTKPEDFTVPPSWVPFPTTLSFRLYDAKTMFDRIEVNASAVSDVYRFGLVIAGCDVFTVRSCGEIESEWLKLFGELHRKPVVPLGLLPPPTRVTEEDGDETWPAISNWLKKQDRESVVYVALGSEVTLSQEHVTELAYGLELSGLPFFWVLRKQCNSEIALPDDGFESRTKDRGVVWTSWAPQLKILDHDRVGCFLSHCGWGSTIEALRFGRPLAMLPFVIDQGLNAMALKEKQVGIEIPRNEEDGSFTRSSVAESLVKMISGEEGKCCKENARKMKKIFADKELHDLYVDGFVEFLQNHPRARTG